MKEPLLNVRNLTVRFHTPDGVVHAVNGVSYQLDEGETLGIVGESGCGKSVHARALIRLIPMPPGEIPNGEVIYRGRDTLKLPEDELHRIRGADIAMVFQDPMTFLNPVLTIGFQITEALFHYNKMTPKEADTRAAELLHMVGIPDARSRLKDYPHQFSGGMRQRAMIAMALSCNPKLLIADEPTTALDVTIQAQIIELVKDLQSRLGMAVMWITHDLGVAASLVKKINVMYAGYLVECEEVGVIFRAPRHPYTRGLLGSLPRLDQQPGLKLPSIPGNPPSLVALPDGCPFAPRCAQASALCREQMPELERAGAGEGSVACWHWKESFRE